ncbi:MAG: hypothetical protein ACYTFG_20195 [Planctomycetota bacterium]|jgi:hypothetical protein
MEAFYMFANFGWGVFFFLLGMAGGVVAAVKLESWWRVLPLAMALFWGVGTGLFMYGQFWMDRQVLEGRFDSSNPALGNPLADDLNLLARSKVKSLPDFPFEGEGPGLLLDSVSMVLSENNRPMTIGGRTRRTRSVVLSFIYPEVPEIDRLYVECVLMQSEQWVVTRIFTKIVEEGKIVEETIWKA